MEKLGVPLPHPDKKKGNPDGFPCFFRQLCLVDGFTANEYALHVDVLIKEEDIGIGHKGAGDGNALALTP